MASKYISLQGRFYLAEIKNGVAGALRALGNVPKFELEIGADVVEHKESMTGQRTTDFTMVNATSVNFSGQLEEIDAENLKYILSGMNHEIATKTVTDASLGTVAVGQEIKLDGYNLTTATFKAGATAIDASKYTLDAKFGTVIFNDVTGLTQPVLATYTTGKVTNTTFASDFNTEYKLFFKGVNTASGDSVACTLWRTKKSPETTFPLIHEELGQYSISGQALADITKQSDASLGLYGHIVTIPAVVAP